MKLSLKRIPAIIAAIGLILSALITGTRTFFNVANMLSVSLFSMLMPMLYIASSVFLAVALFRGKMDILTGIAFCVHAGYYLICCVMYLITVDDVLWALFMATLGVYCFVGSKYDIGYFSWAFPAAGLVVGISGIFTFPFYSLEMVSSDFFRYADFPLIFVVLSSFVQVFLEIAILICMGFAFLLLKSPFSRKVAASTYRPVAKQAPVYTPVIKQQPVYTPVVNQAPVYTPATGQAPVYQQELKQLKALLDEGVISQEDFDAKKKQLLGL